MAEVGRGRAPGALLHVRKLKSQSRNLLLGERGGHGLHEGVRHASAGAVSQYVTGLGVARRLPESRDRNSVADAKFAHRTDTRTIAASGAATRKVQSTSRGPSLTSAAIQALVPAEVTAISCASSRSSAMSDFNRVRR